MIQHYNSVIITNKINLVSFYFLSDIEEDLNQLGDLTISPNLPEDNPLTKANERIRQLEEMVGTLK
jgi:hypothetical protein